MADFISVQTDMSDAMKLFDGLEKGQKTIARHLLAGVGTSVKNRVKKEYRALFKKTSGNLYKSISRRVVRSGKAVVIDTKARAANQVFYGYALAEGSTIRAKSSNYLTFQVDGKWAKKMEVKLPSRDFVAAPANRYLSSPEYREQLDRLVQKEIDKLEKKGIVVSR